MKKIERRRHQLMPGGIPRWIRCWDNGGGYTRFCRKCLHFSDAAICDVNKCGHPTVKAGTEGSFDRYTVVFTGNYRGRGGLCHYLGMSSHPFHPQGFGQHGEHTSVVDCSKAGFAAAVGDKCHLGRRITFQRLPPDCQKLVLFDYMDMWGLSRKEGAKV